MNPATRRQQTFPLSIIQNLLLDRMKKRVIDTPPKFGFGKDKLIGTYKPVFLTKSSGFGFDNVTTCEVFDFITQLWRYVHPAFPLTTNPHTDPVYLDGSLYWLTDVNEPRFCLLIFTLKLFMSSVMLPFPMFLTLSASPYVSSTVAFAFPKKTGLLHKTYGPSNIPTRHGRKCVPLISLKKNVFR
ncbi:unnamed protein product [Eruca vesicaria subsp. sativa]|uniref:F-box associated beta-propeller type 1 domain-containing protein n=1 Tax=Eruca vesicaria subsp. sativa TaxID=29727 RepID=A0ABC8LC31_ERUVS|nr:unnamed protein product [Eruca vesicaria subsp. sativa]